MDNSFDGDNSVVFHGPHGSRLLEISQDYANSSFVPTDRHDEPIWTWDGYSSATAVFDCGGTCEMNGGDGCTFTDNDIVATEIPTGIAYTASVTVDGMIYSNTIKRSYWKEFQAEINSKPDDGLSLITLSHDVIADIDDVPLVVPEGKQIMMMFNGHSIDRNLDTAVANGNVITVNGANSSDLTIWCQKNGTGTLNITAPETGNAGIGGINSENMYSGGSITINGGIICTVGSITINGGIICTVGSSDGSGIGAGRVSGSPIDSAITINGGTVTAEGTGNFGAGIGCIRGEINISGGTVNTIGHDYAPGIGVSDQSYYDPQNLLRINISGGKVTATGGYCAAGIGGVVNRGGGIITISGGEVTAIGGGRMNVGDQNKYAGAGIGSGAAGNNYYKLSTVINITGGMVNAKGGCAYDSDDIVAAGIGIGELRPNMTGGTGSAETTLAWTDDSTETMSVRSNGYNGSVTLDDPFVDNTGTTYSGAIADNSALDNKTLRPYDGMGVTLAGYTISLDGDIAVNFYMELSPEILDHTGVYMQFTVPDTIAEYQDQKVYVNDLTPVTSGNKTNYIFTCRVAAKNMTSKIQAQLIDGDDHSILYTYSVKEYADYLLSHTDGNAGYAKAAPLLEKMIQYGAHAKEFIDETNTLDGLSDVEITAPEIVNNLPSGVSFEGATLSLKSETTLSLYFKSRADLEFSCAGYTVEKSTKGRYQIARIRGIKAKQLNSSMALTVTVGDTSGSVSYSPMNYCYNVLNGDTADENLVSVVKALYQYAQAAKTYFD